MNAQISDKPCYSILEFERAIGLSHAKVYQLIKTREVRSFTIGRRRFISAEALREFIQTREVLSA